MQVRSVLRGVRLSPQKGRLVADLIRGLPVVIALRELGVCRRRKAAKILYAVLYSAASNAEHNVGLDFEDLWVRNVVVEKGPVLRRFSARARGRGERIMKPTSHIYVYVGKTTD